MHPTMPKPDSQPEQNALIEELLSHRDYLHHWLKDRFPDAGDTEDLVQESLFRTVEYSRTQAVRNARSFLFSTARNLAINRIRRAKLEQRLDADVDNVLAFAPCTQPDPFHQTRRSEELAMLREAVASLPSRCRMIFTLRKFDGLSQKEIANRLDLSLFTVQNQSVIGMQKCKQHFLKRGKHPLALH